MGLFGGSGLLGGVLGGLFGGETKPEQQLGRLSNAFYEQKELQRYLPPELREDKIGPTISAGIQGLGDLIKNPGGLAPNVAEAINPRLSAESFNIAQNFRNLQSNQAGAASRNNLPTSIKTALQSALDIAQERAQRGARGEALSQSEALRREDLGNTMKILDAILQFMQSGRGGSIAGLGQTAGLASNRQTANMAFISNLISSIAGMGSPGGGAQASYPSAPGVHGGLDLYGG